MPHHMTTRSGQLDRRLLEAEVQRCLEEVIRQLESSKRQLEAEKQELLLEHFLLLEEVASLENTAL